MEVLFISIYPAPNLQQSGRLADISLFCLHGCRLHSCSERPVLAGVWSPPESLGQASFSSWNLGPKNKNPPPDRFRRWVSRIARYDSRVFSPRRQETHTYSRYNRGKPAWSSGRRESFNEGTETALRSQCSNCRCSIKSGWWGGADPGRKLGGAGQNRTADIDLADDRSWVSSNWRRRSFQSLKARRRPLSCIYTC